MRDGTEGLLVTVADIIALPAFKNVELVAPCEGAERREVRNVGILDCPPDYNEYSVYVAGELILTNLGFAFGNPGMAEKSLLTMLRRDVAAIAVKTVYEPPISDAVRKESTARGVPLYLYDGAYHETVAYQSLDLLQRDRDELDKGKALDELLTAHDGDRVRTRLSALVGVTGSKLQCFAFALRAGDPCSFYAMLDSVSSGLGTVRDGCAIVESASVCRYRDHILAFVSYGARPAMRTGGRRAPLHRRDLGGRQPALRRERGGAPVRWRPGYPPGACRSRECAAPRRAAGALVGPAPVGIRQRRALRPPVHERERAVPLDAGRL